MKVKIQFDDPITKLESILTKADLAKLITLFGEGAKICDLLLSPPINYEVSREIGVVGGLEPGSTIACSIKILKHIPASDRGLRSVFTKKRLYRISALISGSVPVSLVFFKVIPSYIAKFSEGSILTIQGRLEEKNGGYSIAHPTILSREIKDIEVVQKSKTRKKSSQLEGELIPQESVKNASNDGDWIFLDGDLSLDFSGNNANECDGDIYGHSSVIHGNSGAKKMFNVCCEGTINSNFAIYGLENKVKETSIIIKNTSDHCDEDVASRIHFSKRIAEDNAFHNNIRQVDGNDVAVIQENCNKNNNNVLDNFCADVDNISRDNEVAQIFPEDCVHGAKTSNYIKKRNGDGAQHTQNLIDNATDCLEGGISKISFGSESSDNLTESCGDGSFDSTHHCNSIKSKIYSCSESSDNLTRSFGGGFVNVDNYSKRASNEDKLPERGVVNDFDCVRKITPIYKLNGIFSQAKFSSILQKIIPIISWPGDKILTTKATERSGFYAFSETLDRLHAPKTKEDISPLGPIRKHLAYLEMLSMQSALALVRLKTKHQTGISVQNDGQLLNKLSSNLPFKLTNAQELVVGEIFADQASAKKMMRLLQGDVGSGKTIVAVMAAVNAVASGYAVAIMAPTTVLAEQHLQSIGGLVAKIGLGVAMVNNRTTKMQRAKIMEDVNLGKINILIGTHALIYGDLSVDRFGLFIIDEQHRFGVEQRAALFNKNSSGDVLLMTATPIPRTMATMMYGDIDISVIGEKPVGRKMIDTRIMSGVKYLKIVDSFKNPIAKGEKIYWICPMIDASEDEDLACVENRYSEFCKIFKDGEVCLMHGKMPEQEKNAAMTRFVSGDAKLMIATSVIEVGVNVPDATIIAIERAERFGLAQLHQLRGRVGRSDKQSYCFLLYSEGISSNSLQRLKAIKNNHDGFKIAQYDLRWRGSGDLVGIKQSGYGDFKIANLAIDFGLLQIACSEVAKMFEVRNQDPEFEERLSALLKIFNRSPESCMELFRV